MLFDSKSITHDNNGTITSIADTCGTTTYTWDARNRLTAINGFTAGCSPLSADFRYDALGRRIEKTINGKTIRYLYDGLDIVQEIENGTAGASYVRTLDIDEPLARIRSGGARYYHRDALGSVIALTDGSGSATSAYTYGPLRKAGRFPIYWGRDLPERTTEYRPSSFNTRRLNR